MTLVPYFIQAIPDHFSRKGSVILAVLMAVGILLIIFMSGYIAYRSWENDHRCVAALGDGAVWAGHNLCKMPPVVVKGLL